MSNKLSLILIIFISLYICLPIEAGYLKGLETNVFRVAMSLCLSSYSTSLKILSLKVTTECMSVFITTHDRCPIFFRKLSVTT